MYDGPAKTAFFARNSLRKIRAPDPKNPGKNEVVARLRRVRFDDRNAIPAGFTGKRLGWASRMHGKMRTHSTSISHCIHGLYGVDPLIWLTALRGMPVPTGPRFGLVLP